MSLALFGADSATYLRGLWSVKTVMLEPNTTLLKRFRAQTIANASRSMTDQAHWEAVSLRLA